MTFARVRRPTCEARPATWKASPSTYTPPWKYRTTWRGSIPSTVISAVGTPPSAAAFTVTSAGRGCAEIASRSSRRRSLKSLSTGKADCRRIASTVSRCSVLTEDLPSVGLVWQRLRRARPGQSSAENFLSGGRPLPVAEFCREAGEEASPDHGDSPRREWLSRRITIIRRGQLTWVGANLRAVRQRPQCPFAITPLPRKETTV